jgi:beta-glucosidase
MSDWQAQHSGASAALAGLDMSMPGDVRFNTWNSYWGANLTAMMLNGTLPEWRLDDAATRIMAGFYYVGRDKQNRNVNFHSNSKDTFGYSHFYAKDGYGLINQHVDVRADHRFHIRESAAKSTILLKNTNNALPLTGKEKFTGVFGEDADNSPYGPNGCGGRGCDNGTLAIGGGSGTVDFSYLVAPFTAIQNEVLSVSGHPVLSVTNNWATGPINTVARQATVSIVFVDADAGGKWKLCCSRHFFANRLVCRGPHRSR